MKSERQKLFRHGRPEFRPMQHDDVRWMWAARKLEDGADDLDPDSFTDAVSEDLADFARVYIAEDENPQFQDRHGPVAVFGAYYDGWNLEPHVEFFPWATVKNKMRAIVGFLMQQRFQPDIGCIVIHASDESRELFRRLSKYAPIRVGGKIAGGRPGGKSDHIFYVRGKRQS